MNQHIRKLTPLNMKQYSLNNSSLQLLKEIQNPFRFGSFAFLLSLFTFLFSCDPAAKSAKTKYGKEDEKDAVKTNYPSGDKNKNKEPDLQKLSESLPGQPDSILKKVNGLMATIQEGIAGRVLWIRGNQMPSPEQPPQPAAGWKGFVQIFPVQKGALLKMREPSVFEPISEGRLARVQTDEQGCFSLSLPEGTYSIFLELPDGALYANISDGAGQVHPIQVVKQTVTPALLKFDYQAVY